MSSTPFSVNKFIIEPYTGERAIRTNTSSGFAMIENKTSLKPLKTIADAYVSTQKFVDLVPKGSTVYIREELFYQPGWGQKIYDAEGIEGGFMIVESVNVEFIKPLEGKANE